MDRDESGLFVTIKKVCPPYKKISFYFSNFIKNLHLHSDEYEYETIDLYGSNLINYIYTG